MSVPFQIREIDHIVLRARDQDALVRFYLDVVGCSIEKRQDAIGLVQLRAGRSLIDIISIDGKLGRMGGAAPGAEGRNLDHFCVRIEPFAVEALRAHLRERGGSEKVHLQYRKLLKLRNDTTESLRHGKEYLPVLLALDKEKAAVELYRELAELDPAFVPADAESNVRLARRASQLGHAQLALRLVNGFHKRHPRSADIPQMYLMAAQLLSERLGKDAEAKALLSQIRTAYPNHELIPQIDSLMKLIDSISAGRKRWR